MPLATTHAIALVGVEGHPVQVEADLGPGLPGCSLVGLPDAAVTEARDRMRAAIVNSGEIWPARRLTLGLSPAALPKRGSAFDLAMAVAVVAAAGGVPAGVLRGLVLLGELGLDGTVRPVRGVLPAALAAARAGFGRLVVPADNAAEAALVPGLRVLPVTGLLPLLRVLRGEEAPPAPTHAPTSRTGPSCADLADVLGQPAGRRAVEIAAAGAHHLFLLGPPGAGKTMLAARLPGVLPPLTETEALEVTAVHSVAGTLPHGCPLVTWPPLCDPHHSASIQSLIGGGSGLARPGAASLAHHGVLFLDEAPEFGRAALDALRQPLEAGEVVVARSGGTTRFPARFQLVLAANPCPCAPTSGEASDCGCSSIARRRYLGRLSGPLLDRVDLRVEIDPVSRAELLADAPVGESTAAVADRVAAARARTARRLADTPWHTNAAVPGGELRRRWPPSRGVLAPLDAPLRQGRLTARGVASVVRVAWTLADLAGRPRPTRDDVSEALYLRTGVKRR
jgi:magnesium chelatase family protein